MYKRLLSFVLPSKWSSWVVGCQVSNTSFPAVKVGVKVKRYQVGRNGTYYQFLPGIIWNYLLDVLKLLFLKSPYHIRSLDQFLAKSKHFEKKSRKILVRKIVEIEKGLDTNTNRRKIIFWKIYDFLGFFAPPPQGPTTPAHSPPTPPKLFQRLEQCFYCPKLDLTLKKLNLGWN